MSQTTTMATDNTLSAKQIDQMETAMPMWKLVLHQFIQHRMALAGAIFIALVLLTAALADLISVATGLSPESQNVGARYLQPLSYSELSSGEREDKVQNWIQNNPEAAERVQKALLEKNLVSGTTSDAIFNLLNLESEQQSLALAQVTSETQNVSPTLGHLFSSFRQFHLLGTDEVGRDVFIRLIYGARVSLSVGILVALAAAGIGLFIGGLAGFYGGWIDSVLMRLTDALLSLPMIPLLIIFSVVDLQKLPLLKSVISSQNESIWKLVIIICLFSWMSVARLVRGSVLSLREREFVMAARTLGAKDRTILFKHMFPNVIAPMLVAITLGVGESILFEAALSYLGLGIMPPTPSWGNMLNNAQEVIYNNKWLTIIPGVMILLTTMSFNFLGDGLQDAIDPKSVRR